MKYQKRFSYIGFVFLLAMLYVSFSPLVSVARLYWLDGKVYTQFTHENKELSNNEQQEYKANGMFHVFYFFTNVQIITFRYF